MCFLNIWREEGWHSSTGRALHDKMATIEKACLLVTDFLTSLSVAVSGTNVWEVQVAQEDDLRESHSNR